MSEPDQRPFAVCGYVPVDAVRDLRRSEMERMLRCQAEDVALRLGAQLIGDSPTRTTWTPMKWSHGADGNLTRHRTAESLADEYEVLMTWDARMVATQGNDRDDRA